MAQKQSRKSALSVGRNEPPEYSIPGDLLPEERVVPLKAFEWDRVFYRIAVVALGAAAIFSTIGIFVLAWNAMPASEGLIALGATALGALVGLFRGTHGRG
jgi:hypothetical protein